MIIQKDLKGLGKYREDKITLDLIKRDHNVVKIIEKNEIFRVKYKDGTEALFIKLINGECPHPFVIIGEGFEGKFYYACDTGSCNYRRELTDKEARHFIKEA